MKIWLKRNVIYLITGLIVLSFLALWISDKSKDFPILTEEEAVQAAIVYLAKNKITVDPKKADVVFSYGKWNVFFLANPYMRPAHILIRINPITGNTKIIPLR